MYTVNSDIENFNHFFKVNVDGLKARGKCTYDLMIYLFEAYQVSFDSEFFRDIKTKGDYYDGVYNISKDELMTFALNKFEIL